MFVYSRFLVFPRILEAEAADSCLGSVQFKKERSRVKGSISFNDLLYPRNIPAACSPPVLCNILVCPSQWSFSAVVVGWDTPIDGADMPLEF